MKLTEEQKEHFRGADRQGRSLNLTWHLFTMFLSEDKSPENALQRAREAMEVWQDFEDANWIEPPEIEEPDFTERMQSLLVQFQPLIMEALKSRQPVMPPWPMPPFVVPQQPVRPTPAAPGSPLTDLPITPESFRIAVVGRVLALFRVALDNNGNVYHGGLIPNLTSITDCLAIPFERLKEEVAKNPILDPAKPFDPFTWQPPASPFVRPTAQPEVSPGDSSTTQAKEEKS